MSLKNSSPRFKAYTVFILFLILAFLLPAVRGQGDSRLYILVGAVPLFVLVFSVVCTRLFSLDRLLVLLSLTLCTMNILAPAAAEPDAALLRALSAAGSLIFLLAGSLLIRSFRPSSSAALVFLIPSLLLLLAPMISVPDDFFASLSKPGAVLLLIPVVSFLSLRSRIPAMLLGFAGFALLLLNTEILYAIAWGLTFILMFWICDGLSLWSLLTAAGSVGLLIAYFFLFPASRSVEPVSPLLPDIGSFGFFGPGEPPVFSEEFPLPENTFLSLGFQYGLVFLLILTLMMLLVLWRGISLARQARTFFLSTLGAGAVILIWIRVLAALVSLFGFSPFPRSSFPFLTGSFPETGSDLFLIGVLCGISARNEQDLKEDTHLAMLAH